MFRTCKMDKALAEREAARLRIGMKKLKDLIPTWTEFLGGLHGIIIKTSYGPMDQSLEGLAKEYEQRGRLYPETQMLEAYQLSYHLFGAAITTPRFELRTSLVSTLLTMNYLLIERIAFHQEKEMKDAFGEVQLPPFGHFIGGAWYLKYDEPLLPIAPQNVITVLCHPIKNGPNPHFNRFGTELEKAGSKDKATLMTLLKTVLKQTSQDANFPKKVRKDASEVLFF